MNRRHFLGAIAALPAIAVVGVAAEKITPHQDPSTLADLLADAFDLAPLELTEIGSRIKHTTGTREGFN